MHDKKVKSTGKIRKTFFSLLGNERSKAFLKFMLTRKSKAVPLSFPVNNANIKEILIILPEQHLKVLHQLRNVISLMTIFKHAGITLLCERHVSSYIKMIPGLNLVEYDANDHYSSEFSQISQQFREKTDICFLLDEKPELPILYLAGATGAAVRVGYCDAGEYPFINLHVRPSPSRLYLADRYTAMAEMFGAKHGELKWRVAQKTIEEVDHLIKELKIAPDAQLVGFDALYFLRKCGTDWTEQFVRQVTDLHLGTLYFTVENATRESELVWLCKQNVPTFADLSASRMAALISKSKLIISGNTPMYALAGLLQRPAIGLFKDDELPLSCPQSQLLRGAGYSDRPDNTSIAALLALLPASHGADKPAK